MKNQYIGPININIDISLFEKLIGTNIDIEKIIHIDIGFDIDIGKIGPIFFRFSWARIPGQKFRSKKLFRPKKLFRLADE